MELLRLAGFLPVSRSASLSLSLLQPCLRVEWTGEKDNIALKTSPKSLLSLKGGELAREDMDVVGFQGRISGENCTGGTYIYYSDKGVQKRKYMLLA